MQGLGFPRMPIDEKASYWPVSMGGLEAHALALLLEV